MYKVIRLSAEFATPVNSLESGSIAQRSSSRILWKSAYDCLLITTVLLAPEATKSHLVGRNAVRDEPRCSLDLLCPPVLSQLSILQEQPRRDAVDVTLFCSPSSSPSSSSTLTPTSAGLQDPSASCPGTPSAQHNKLGMMQGVGCPSPVATLKRPTALSRHASAAGLLHHLIIVLLLLAERGPSQTESGRNTIYDL